MEYTELSDYPLPSGRVVEWSVTAADDAWEPDPRRFSYTHIGHARRAVDAGDGWRSEWIGTAFLVESPLDEEALARTLQRWYARHEPFRSSLVVDDARDDGFARRTVAADRVRAVGRPVAEHLTSTAVYEYLDDHFNSSISPLRWPHCVAVTVEPAQAGSFLFVFAADHTVMDAYTQVFAIDELTAIYNAELTGVPDELPEFGSYIDFSEAERTRGAEVAANDQAVAGWSAFLDSSAATPTQPEPMPGFPRQHHGADHLDDDTASAHQASMSAWILDAAQTAEFHRVCKDAGANMQAGIYTALTIAAHRAAGHADLRLINPIHTRNEARWGGSAGWFVDIVPVHLKTGAAMSFRDAISTVAESAGAYRSVASAPYAVVADLLEDTGVVTPPKFVVSYIDMRAADGAQHWERRKARVLRSATRQADEVYLWINRVPSGTNISARYPSGARGQAVNAFIATLTEILRAIVADGDTGYTAHHATAGKNRR